jgi:hypothetical protein
VGSASIVEAQLVDPTMDPLAAQRSELEQRKPGGLRVLSGELIWYDKLIVTRKLEWSCR